jgi:hypothetical protein
MRGEEGGTFYDCKEQSRERVVRGKVMLNNSAGICQRAVMTL